MCGIAGIYYGSGAVPPDSELVMVKMCCSMESIRVRLRSDVPAGCFLSGGVDSAGFDESVYVSEVAKQYGTNYSYIYLDSSSLEELPESEEIY